MNRKRLTFFCWLACFSQLARFCFFCALQEGANCFSSWGLAVVADVGRVFGGGVVG